MPDNRQQPPDYYAVLGVEFDASDDELRRAWRVAVKQWHPDTNRSPEAHGMMTRINEAWEVLGNPERRAEYDTVYFRLRATIAEEERRRREAERLEWERRERLRQRELERKRREAEAARRRAEEEERQRAERIRQERERQERLRRERERHEAETRRAAEREREKREREQRERARRHVYDSQSFSDRESGQRGVRRRIRLPVAVRKIPFWAGAAAGFTFSAVLGLIVAGVVVSIVQQSSDSGDQDSISLVETAGWGTVRASGDGFFNCSARAGGVRNVAAFGESPRAEAWFITPDVNTWSAGFLYHLSGGGYAAAAVRRSGERYEVVSWTQTGSAEVARHEARFRPDLLNPSHLSVPNTFRIDVSDRGTDLVVNDVLLMQVPPNDLRPHPSAVHFCAGFFNNEPMYTVQFVGLRGTVDTDSDYRGVVNRRQHWPPLPAPTADSASMSSDNDLTALRDTGGGSVTALPRRSIDCSSTVAAFGENFVAEVEIPEPPGDAWSVGFLYHVSESGYSAALVRRRASMLDAAAWTSTGTNTIAWQENPIDPESIMPSNSNQPNVLRIEVSETGTNLVLNDSDLLQVDPRDLRPFASGVRLCAGFWDDEPQYAIRYLSLRGAVGETVMSSLPTPRVIQVTARPAATASPTLVPSPTPTPTPIQPTIRTTATPWPTPVPIPTATPSPGPTPTPVPIPTVTPSPTPTSTPVPIPTATPSPTPTPVPIPTLTPTPDPRLILRGSGTLYTDADTWFLGCPIRTDEPAHLSSSATSGRVEFSFGVPSASDWSIGLVYHRAASDTLAATYVARTTETGITVGHETRLRGEVAYSMTPGIASGLFYGTVGNRNKVAIHTDEKGTDLELNGTVVLQVPPSELRPTSSRMQVCSGLFTNEPEDYAIDYANLRAWTE